MTKWAVVGYVRAFDQDQAELFDTEQEAWQEKEHMDFQAADGETVFKVEEVNVAEAEK